MTKNDFKTILFASLIAAMILSFSIMETTQAASNQNTNEMVRQETSKDQKIDQLGQAIEDKQVESRELAKLSET